MMLRIYTAVWFRNKPILARGMHHGHLISLRCTNRSKSDSGTISVLPSIKNSMSGKRNARQICHHTFSVASSSSLRLRERRTRTRVGTLRTPFEKRNLFSLASIRTSLFTQRRWSKRGDGNEGIYGPMRNVSLPSHSGGIAGALDAR